MIWFFLLFILLKNQAIAIEATSSATIVINKFQFDPPMTGVKEWVEIYNTTDLEIDLNNWYITDDRDTPKKLLTGKKIEGKGYLTYENSSGWLNNDADTVKLKIGDTVVDTAKYTVGTKKVTLNEVVISELYSELKGKWIGRSDVGSSQWKVFTDSDGPINGAISYFDGYKTVIENVGITISPATDFSGIGSSEIVVKESKLDNNNCPEFYNLNIGNSLSDGRCYIYEYKIVDGVGNTSIFTSNSIVKFDTSKPEFKINKAFRNIFSIKSELFGSDIDSGIWDYKYSLSELDCGSTKAPNNWINWDSNIINVGYSGNPLSIWGKNRNRAGIESNEYCFDLTIDVMAPKIINITEAKPGKYKIGEVVKFGFEFDEEVATSGNNFEIKLNTSKADFTKQMGNVLYFEYKTMMGDLTSNLQIGETKIILNGGNIFDMAGNEANLTTSNLINGIEIDGIVPIINLIGETYIEIPQFSIYQDSGVKASDVPDGDITDKVLVENNLNIDKGGIYEIKYNVVDSAGNMAENKRIIKVIDNTAPKVTKLNHLTIFQFSFESSEEGYIEWQGKCEGVDNNLMTGSNLIKIKNKGDGAYDNCQIRAWDKWGNVGLWQTIDSFTVDTTAPIIKFEMPTPEDNSFDNHPEISISIMTEENLKNCYLTKEKLISGDFETGNIDGWDGDWIADDLHFTQGKWAAKSPDLTNKDLTEKSIWQKVKMDSKGTLLFWWRVSSEKDWDYLKFYIDGILIDKISGETGWEEVKHDLEIGEHIIKFTYSKDYSGESGADAGWVDGIEINGGENLITMDILNNRAFGKLNNLTGGGNKYRVQCTDLDDNKSNIIERNVFKNIDKKSETPEPTPFTIFKSSVIAPTVKLAKPTNTKTPIKVMINKSPEVLGVATTLGQSTKLKSSIPWEEIEFWSVGMAVLGIASGIILLDKKVI